jgi:hypothetical protein
LAVNDGGAVVPGHRRRQTTNGPVRVRDVRVDGGEGVEHAAIEQPPAQLFADDRARGQAETEAAVDDWNVEREGVRSRQLTPPGVGLVPLVEDGGDRASGGPNLTRQRFFVEAG